MQHLNEPALTAYVANEVDDTDRLAVDAHLSECDACVGRVRARLMVRDSFAEVWMSWSAEEHGRIARQLRMLQALDAEQRKLTPRAIQWLAAIADGTELAVKVLVDRGERVAGIAARLLPPSYEFEFRPVVTGVGSPAEEAQLDQKIVQSSAALAANQLELALSMLREVSHVNAMIAQSANSIIYRDNRKYAEVAADARRGSLLVKHWPVSGAAADYVLLLPADITQTPALGVLAPVSGEEYLLASFDEFPNGACDLIIGPSH